MRRRIRSEDGVAMTVAMFTLAVIALFSALIASTAGQLGETSNQDRDSKRALGAAEAGINTALHRLNNAPTPLDNLGCFTDVQLGVLAEATPVPGVVATGDVPLSVQAGHCPGAAGRAGNDGTYTYFITLLNNGQHCDAQYTTQTEVTSLLALGIGGISVLRRCITSIGVVNGVQRRVQREVYSEFRLFQGLIGTGDVTVSTLANLGTSHVGSNGLVTMAGGSLFGGQVEIYGEDEPQIFATGVWGVTHRADPWILDPVEVSDINAGTITCVGPLILIPCDTSVAGLHPASRRVRVPTGYTVTIAAGDHYICELSVTGGSLLVGGEARVFIDDDCPAGEGFTMQGGLVNATGIVSAENLQIYVEGDSTVSIRGGVLATANITLYAPRSSVVVEQGGGLLAPIVKGSISAESITIGQGATFVGDPLLDITTPFEQIAGVWHPGNWSECPAKPAEADDPHSGCNG
ncbi:MAG: hypothetical protein WD844_14325 [Thermoleophilaceae bacterium]